MVTESKTHTTYLRNGDEVFLHFPRRFCNCPLQETKVLSPGFQWLTESFGWPIWCWVFDLLEFRQSHVVTCGTQETKNHTERNYDQNN